MIGGKVACYNCEGKGKVLAYLRIDCWQCDKYKYFLKLSGYGTLKKCKDCHTQLPKMEVTCPVCRGKRTVDWIDSLFRKYKDG